MGTFVRIISTMSADVYNLLAFLRGRCEWWSSTPSLGQCPLGSRLHWASTGCEVSLWLPFLLSITVEERECLPQSIDLGSKWVKSYRIIRAIPDNCLKCHICFCLNILRAQNSPEIIIRKTCHCKQFETCLCSFFLDQILFLFFFLFLYLSFVLLLLPASFSSFPSSFFSFWIKKHPLFSSCTIFLRIILVHTLPSRAVCSVHNVLIPLTGSEGSIQRFPP